MPYFYLSLAVVAEVIGTSALKAADGFTKPLPTLIVAAGYGTTFYLLSLIVQTMPLGIVYAVWSGAGIGKSSTPWVGGSPTLSCFGG